MERLPCLTKASFILAVIFQANAYEMKGCNHVDNFDIVKTTQPSIQCTGIQADKDVHWTVTSPAPNATPSLNASCSVCNNSEPCQPCSVSDDSFAITRSADNTSTLQVLKPLDIESASVVKCSDQNGTNSAACTIYVIEAYKMSGCENGVLRVKENKTAAITCENILSQQNMNWTIIYPNGTVSAIAKCTLYDSTCLTCRNMDSSFNVTRETNSSTLVIENKDRLKDGAVLRCSKLDNVTFAECQVRVEEPMDSASPLLGVGVGVGVGALVLIIIIVVVVVVVVLRRRSSATTSNESDSINPVRPYEELRIPTLSEQNIYTNLQTPADTVT